MGRNKNKRGRPFRSNDSPIFYQRPNEAACQASKIVCVKCGRNLFHYNPYNGLICQICRRLELKNAGCGRRSQPYAQIHSYPNAINNHDSFVSNLPQRIQDDAPWQRRIYSTPSYTNQNNSTINIEVNDFQSPLSHRSASLKPKFESQTLNSSQTYQQRVFYNSNTEVSSSSHLYPPLQYKRKSFTEENPRKRIRTSPSFSDINISSYDELNSSIWEHFNENVQTKEMYDIKWALRDRLQCLIQRNYPESDLFLFGSSMTGFASQTSDIDMCLMFHGLKISKNRVLNTLWDLRNLFAKNQYLTKLQVIRAKVPILKFLDKQSGFEVDLNICNPTGVRNSQLLRSYGRIDERLRPLILAIKSWARFHNINDAKTGTLSSYSLGLMIIHYLQYRCHPPVLPSLQVLQPDKYLRDTDVRALSVNEELPQFQSKNRQNLGQLLVGFIQYYSKEYDYINSRISIRLGCILARVDKLLSKDNKLRYWIDIEEPFDQSNTARSVNSPEKCAYIKSVFDSCYDHILQHGDIGQIFF